MSVGSRLWQKKVIVLGAVLAIAAVSTLAMWFFILRTSGPIPHAVAKGLNISLYYPTRLPSGYQVDRESFKREGEVLIFSIKAPKNRNIAVAQQAIPADAPARTKKTTPFAIPGEKEFTVAAGQAHIGLWGDKYVSDIITPRGTWVILNATGFTTDEATAVTQSFTEL